MSSRRTLEALAALLLCAILVAPAFTGDALAKENTDPPAAQKGDTITWVKDVTKGFELAAKKNVPVMICINSRRVDGGKVEPAAKGLRDIIYKDPRVVTKSRKFVCVFLTSEGSSDDYGELRMRFGIDGLIVSPQHVFAHPKHKTGDEPLFRKEYWPYRQDVGGVEKLLEMMDTALAGFRQREGTPEKPMTPEGEKPEAEKPGPDAPEDDPAPAGADERARWIQKTLRITQSPIRTSRREALRMLVTSDQEGDCINPLVALLPEAEKDVYILIDFVRALGRPGIEAAVEPFIGYLKHKEEELRANAAVSLEYIGSAASVDALMARAKRERVPVIANHLCRAAGRCGAGDKKVRTFLVKQIKAAKANNEEAFGPIVGLAYFEGDEKAARDVEKLLKPLATAGWGAAMRRNLLLWTLSEIRDPKSGPFVKKVYTDPAIKSDNRWTRMVVPFYEAIEKYCGGDDAARDGIGGGITRSLEFAGGTEKYRGDARKERDISQFEPKGEWELEARSWGGGDGRGGGGRKR